MFWTCIRIVEGSKGRYPQIFGNIFPITPPSTATSLLENDDMGHDSAMTDRMREAIPHGEGGGHWPMTPQKLQKAIPFKLELDFGRVYSHWKALGEHKAMVSSSE